jgi:hypothetical protein
MPRPLVGALHWEACAHAGKEVYMNVNMPSLLDCALPGKSCNFQGFPKAQMPDEERAAPTFLDKVDVSSFSPMIDNGISGSCEKNITYEENVHVFKTDTKIAYENQDGSKVFIDFSYQTMTKTVRYEVTQSMEAVRTQDDSEGYGRPLGFYFGPNATANRILDVAQGLVHKFMAMEDDQKKLAVFINNLLRAMEKGFGGLHKATRGIPSGITGMVRETYDRVMDGMGALQNALMGGKESGAVTLTYEEEVTYTSASMEISVLA